MSTCIVYGTILCSISMSYMHTYTHNKHAQHKAHTKHCNAFAYLYMYCIYRYNTHRIRVLAHNAQIIIQTVRAVPPLKVA